MRGRSLFFIALPVVLICSSCVTGLPFKFKGNRSVANVEKLSSWETSFSNNDRHHCWQVPANKSDEKFLKGRWKNGAFQIRSHSDGVILRTFPTGDSPPLQIRLGNDVLPSAIISTGKSNLILPLVPTSFNEPGVKVVDLDTGHSYNRFFPFDVLKNQYAFTGEVFLLRYEDGRFGYAELSSGKVVKLEAGRKIRSAADSSLLIEEANSSVTLLDLERNSVTYYVDRYGSDLRFYAMANNPILLASNGMSISFFFRTDNQGWNLNTNGTILGDSIVAATAEILISNNERALYIKDLQNQRVRAFVSRDPIISATALPGDRVFVLTKRGGSNISLLEANWDTLVTAVDGTMVDDLFKKKKTLEIEYDDIYDPDKLKVATHGLSLSGDGSKLAFLAGAYVQTVQEVPQRGFLSNFISNLTEADNINVAQNYRASMDYSSMDYSSMDSIWPRGATPALRSVFKSNTVQNQVGLKSLFIVDLLSFESESLDVSGVYSNLQLSQNGNRILLSRTFRLGGGASKVTPGILTGEADVVLDFDERAYGFIQSSSWAFPNMSIDGMSFTQDGRSFSIHCSGDSLAQKKETSSATEQQVFASCENSEVTYEPGSQLIEDLARLSRLYRYLPSRDFRLIMASASSPRLVGRFPELFRGVFQSVQLTHPEDFEILFGKYLETKSGLSEEQTSELDQVCRPQRQTQSIAKQWSESIERKISSVMESEEYGTEVNDWYFLALHREAMESTSESKRKKFLEEAGLKIVNKLRSELPHMSVSQLYYLTKPNLAPLFGLTAEHTTEITYRSDYYYSNSVVPIVLSSRPMTVEQEHDHRVLDHLYMATFEPIPADRAVRKDFSWSTGGRSYSGSIVGNLRNSSFDFLQQASPDYQSMRRDGLLQGLVVIQDNNRVFGMPVMNHYIGYYRSNGFKLFAERPSMQEMEALGQSVGRVAESLFQKVSSTELEAFVEEEFSSGRLDYILKEGHSAGDDNFISFTRNSEVVFGYHPDKQEIVVIVNGDRGGERAYVNSVHLDQWMTSRDRGASPGQLIYFNTSCGTISTVRRQFVAASSEHFVPIPSDSTAYFFRNRPGNALFEMLDGFRKSRSYQEIRDSMSSDRHVRRGANVFYFPDQRQYRERVVDLDSTIYFETFLYDEDGNEISIRDMLD